ncbi:VanW family protein [Candidatus Villigracilis saccharophilus]|uniref:VanW family protein n=1 Tax=Candidatus Villigracilis saccharophilus TaxID=3140684 RepID=UPI003136392E|nr:VanW family protein [Anaerolineales bacterium]
MNAKFVIRRDLPRQIIAVLVGGLFLFLAVVLTWTLGYQLFYAGRIFPGVSVAGVDLSGLAPNDAALKLNQTLSYPITGKILFRDADKLWVASPAELGMVFDPSASSLAAYKYGRSGGLFGALASQVRAGGLGSDVAPVIIFDQRVAYTYLQNIAVQVDKPVLEASLRVDGTNVIAEPGQLGRFLNLDATLIYLGAQLQSFRDGEVALVIQESAPRLLDVSSQAEAARQILSQPLTLTLPNFREGDPGPWTYDVPVLVNMLGVTIDDSSGTAQMKVGLDRMALRNTLTELKTFVDRLPDNARFVFNDGTGQIEPIAVSTIGRSMDVEASIAAINDALLRGEHTIALSVSEEQPAVADTATGAELGVVQLVGEQTTYFYGSSDARIQNIVAAAERYHGLLVAPGETFSMGSVLGDVSLENGFAEALIIYGGRTIKGVGGGVCQVSTTLFRTVFFAGYPVAERYSHAYRVSYYEMDASGSVDTNFAGMDATVYFPLVDFKFVNDTSSWLLMETYVNVGARTITWKLYSTSDGRSVTWETTGPSNVVPPPEPLFEENSELRKNEIKQIDYAAQGADVNVTRTVWINGQVYFTDQFQTHYQPWQAICQYGPDTEDPEKKARKNNQCLSPSN